LTKNMPYTIVRLGAVFGPGTWSFGLVEAQILHRRKFVFVGGGKFASGVIIIDDAIECLLQAALAAGSLKRIYNAAANFEVTYRTYYSSIAHGIQAPIPWLSIPVWFARILATLFEFFYRIFRVDHRPLFTHFILNLMARNQLWPIAAAKRDFGWEPRVPFGVAMARHVQWLNSRPDLWKED